MKKLTKYLVAASAAICSFGTFAGSGKAFVPTWVTLGIDRSTYISVSNITNNPIKLNFIFHGLNGELVIPSEARNIQDGILAPKSTGFVRLTADEYDQGFGVIEWENTNEADDDAVAVIAHGERVASTNRSYAIVINNGMAF